LERYQEAVRAEGGFDTSVALTHRMAEQLANTVTTRAERGRLTNISWHTTVKPHPEQDRSVCGYAVGPSANRGRPAERVPAQRAGG